VEEVKSCVLLETACKVSEDCPAQLTCVIAPKPSVSCAQPRDEGGKSLPCRDEPTPPAPETGSCQPAYGGSYTTRNDAEAGSLDSPTTTKGEPPVAPEAAAAGSVASSAGGSGASHDASDSDGTPVVDPTEPKCSVSQVGAQTSGYGVLFGLLGVALALGMRRRRSR
jgi:MYXO-CTERM domain-containing protein